MEIQNTLDSIPADLFHEIFLRFPLKSIARGRCVSKVLASRLDSKDFKQLFFTKSLTRPHLLFAVRLKNWEWVFYSSPQPQPQDPHEKLSLDVKADFHTKFPKVSQPDEFMHASGMFYFPDVRISTKGEYATRVICNPSTGQYVVLPKLKTCRGDSISFFGFDPIKNQFKVLLMNTVVNNEKVNLILTLGTGKMRWRMIECPLLSHYPSTPVPTIGFPQNPKGIKGMCINGVVYYLATLAGTKSYVIVCFHVRTETFNLIEVELMNYQLINYKGKLGMISLREIDVPVGWGIALQLHLRVLEDVERQEWSKHDYVLPEHMYTCEFSVGVLVVGLTAADEFVLTIASTCKPFYVYYFNHRKNTLRTVEVQGFEDDGLVRMFMDHVEYLHVHDAKQFKSNVYDSLREGRRTFESINRFEALCLSDEEDDD